MEPAQITYHQMAAKKPLLSRRNVFKPRTTKMDEWRSVLWTGKHQFQIFFSPIVSLCMCMRHGGGGEMTCMCVYVGVLCRWHCWGFIKNERHTEPAWPPKPPACNNIQFAFGWTNTYFSKINEPKHIPRLFNLTKKKCNGVLHSMTWPPQSSDLKAKGPTSAQHLWELIQDCFKIISGD